jgi:ABC-type sugar transport system ATPase subunit
MATVELDGVAVRKGGQEVLSGVDLTVDDGLVLALLGSTGSGKTTVLRAVAGLDQVERGAVRLGGVDVTAWKPGERDVAIVFQRPVVYPHRNAGRNISFPLELRGDPVEEIRERVGAEARALHIERLLTTKPKELSAGQLQAVQVARSLVRQPRVLLLDEPFANIDASWADHLRREVMLIQRGFGVTTIVALNEPSHALAMADRLAVVDDGVISQVGAPLDVYDEPRTVNAALLTGDADVAEVRVEADVEGAWLVHPGYRVRAWRPAVRELDGQRLQMVVRPEWWHLDEHGTIEATVDRAIRLGTATSLWCRSGDQPMTVKLAGTNFSRFDPGDTIRLRLSRFVLIDPRTGVAV